MFFSIVIPVFNTRPFLSKCLDSVLGQSYVDFEVLCVDDQSTDGSLDLLYKYAHRDRRVKVISNSKGGVSKARNTALELALGQYVLFVDSDDWLLPGALAILAQEVESNDILVYSSSRFYEQNQVLSTPMPCELASYLSGWDYYRMASRNDDSHLFGAIWGKVYSNTMLQTNHIRFIEDLSYNEDVMFAIEACSVSGQVKVIPNSLYVYRIRQTGSLMSTYSERRFLDMARVANLLADKYLMRYDLDQNTIRRTISSFYRNSFLWSDDVTWSKLKEIVNWTSFKVASKVSLKASLIFWGYRYALDVTVHVIKKFHM